MMTCSCYIAHCWCDHRQHAALSHWLLMSCKCCVRIDALVWIGHAAQRNV